MSEVFPTEWFSDFFESPDSIPLSFFPTPGATGARARREARRRKVAAPLVRGDARRLPCRDACLDVALNLFNSFGYCATDEENEQELREAARVLKPGGRFLLATC